MATEIILPGSKSIAARAIILDRVYGTHMSFENLPDCDDTRELLAAFTDMDAGKRDFNLGTGGTSLRFFLAYVASLPGMDCRVDCSDALRRRPLATLVDALRSAGAHIDYLGEEGRAPLRVRGAQLDGAKVSVDCSVSSQFASAMLLVSHLWENPYTPVRAGEVVSRPYLDMTIRMVRQFEDLAARHCDVYAIEPDWSAASYFYEFALLHPETDFVLKNIVSPEMSLQGDARCAELFANPGGEVDMNATPDLVPALAVGLCRAGIHFRFTGVAHLRHKECDRLDAITGELAKAGYRLEVGEDSLAWSGEHCEALPGAVFDSHGDHRIAMALWAAGFCNINGKEAVTKSFPAFYREMDKLS